MLRQGVSVSSGRSLRAHVTLTQPGLDPPPLASLSPSRHEGLSFPDPSSRPLPAFSWPCWALAGRGHFSASTPISRCGNLSPRWALAHVKLRGWGAAQGARARARPAGAPPPRLTWTGRACGLGLQRCGLLLWEAGVRSLSLFGLHVSEEPVDTAPEGREALPPRCTYHRPPGPPRTGAAPGAASAAGTRQSLSPPMGPGPRGGAIVQGVPQGCAYPAPVPTPSPLCQFPHLGVTQPPATQACPLGPRTSPWPLCVTPCRCPFCRKLSHVGFRSLRTCEVGPGAGGACQPD